MKNNIQQLRKAMHLSQEDLAAKTDVSRQTINSIETGKFDPSLPLAVSYTHLTLPTTHDV